MSRFTPKMEGDLSRLMMGCLLYRLGGEQVFTMEEIDAIKETVAGVQVLLTPDDKILVRVKTPDAYKNLDEQLKNLEPGDQYDGM